MYAKTFWLKHFSVLNRFMNKQTRHSSMVKSRLPNSLHSSRIDCYPGLGLVKMRQSEPPPMSLSKIVLLFQHSHIPLDTPQDIFQTEVSALPNCWFSIGIDNDSRDCENPHLGGYSRVFTYRYISGRNSWLLWKPFLQPVSQCVTWTTGLVPELKNTDRILNQFIKGFVFS